MLKCIFVRSHGCQSDIAFRNIGEYIVFETGMRGHACLPSQSLIAHGHAPGLGHCNLVKNLVINLVINLVKNLVKPQVFLEAEVLTRNLGFLEDDGLRILQKCIGDH